MGRLVEPCPPGDVGAWVTQAQPASLQGDIDRVRNGGVESLGVIAVGLIHPALEENYVGVKSNRKGSKWQHSQLQITFNVRIIY